MGIIWGFGLAFFWVFLIPLAIALVATPIVLLTRSGTRKTTEKELAKFEQISPRDGVIKANDSLAMLVIFPKTQKETTLEFTYLDPVTGVSQAVSEKFSL